MQSQAGKAKLARVLAGEMNQGSQRQVTHLTFENSRGVFLIGPRIEYVRVFQQLLELILMSFIAEPSDSEDGELSNMW